MTDTPRDCAHGALARSCDRCADAREIAELKAELAMWCKLQDPAILHQNLLRGLPAKLTREQAMHLCADDLQRMAELEAERNEMLSKAAANHLRAEAFKADAESLRAEVERLTAERDAAPAKP